MSLVYISTGDGQSTTYDEDQVHSLLQQGILSPETLYWKEGMAEWQPLRNWRSASANPPHVPQAMAIHEKSGIYTFTKNPLGLTKVLKVLLWLYLVAQLISGLSDFAEFRLLSQEGGFTEEDAEVNDSRQQMIALLSLPVLFATWVVFGMWIHRANRNAHGFGASNMKFTPGWAVGWYFVPILNLVRPYQAMKEIWQVSTNPMDWQSVKPSSFLTLWWTMWVISCMLGNATLRISMKAETVEQLTASAAVSMVAGFFEVLLALVAMKLVTTIIEKQKALTGA